MPTALSFIKGRAWKLVLSYSEPQKAWFPFFLAVQALTVLKGLPRVIGFSHPQLSNLTEIHDVISGMARCPYSPQHNSTALLTASGELYAATAMDFPGRDPAIYRSLGLLPPLRTAQYNSKWLNGKSYSHSCFPSHVSVMPGYMVLKIKLSQFLKKSISSKEIKM